MPLLVHTSHVLLLGTIESRTRTHHAAHHALPQPHSASRRMTAPPDVVRRVLAQELLLA